MAVTHLTDQTWDEFCSHGTVLVDFWATWCPPCKLMSPLLEEMSEESTVVKFGAIDVDKYPAITSKYEVRAMPTFLLLVNGIEVNRFIGARSKAQLNQEIIDSL